MMKRYEGNSGSQSRYTKANSKPPNVVMGYERLTKIDRGIPQHYCIKESESEKSFFKKPLYSRTTNPIELLIMDLNKLSQIMVEKTDARFSKDSKIARDLFKDMELQTRYITENLKKLAEENNAISAKNLLLDNNNQQYQREAENFKLFKDYMLQQRKDYENQNKMEREKTQRRMEQLEYILNKIYEELIRVLPSETELRDEKLKDLRTLLQSIADFSKEGDRSSSEEVSKYIQTITSAVKKLKESLNKSHSLSYSDIYKKSEKSEKELHCLEIILESIARNNTVDLTIIKNENVRKVLEYIVFKIKGSKVIPNSIDEKWRENIESLGREKENMLKDLERTKSELTKAENEVKLLKSENKRIKDVNVFREQDFEKREAILQEAKSSLNEDLKAKIQVLQDENNSIHKQLEQAFDLNENLSVKVEDLQNQLKKAQQPQVHPDFLKVKKELDQKNIKLRNLEMQFNTALNTINSRSICKLDNLKKQIENKTRNSLQFLSEKIDLIQKRISKLKHLRSAKLNESSRLQNINRNRVCCIYKNNNFLLLLLYIIIIHFIIIHFFIIIYLN